MDNDGKPTDCKEQTDEERQDRRQFFNGLGKWSLAIITAVSSLAGYGNRAQASREDPPKLQSEPHGPAWAARDDYPLQKMAGYFKRRPYQEHTKTYSVHVDQTKHFDFNRIQ